MIFEWIRRLLVFPTNRVMWTGGGVFLLLSVLLLVIHSVEVRRVRDIGLPLATVVPDLERRLRVLEEQVELARLHDASNRGAPEEFVHVYVLPADASFDRLIATFELLRDVLQHEGQLLAMSAINLGERIDAGGIARWPVYITMQLSEEGLKTVSLYLRIAGLFTVADVLSSKDIEQLFFYAESENPVGIVALEQFLSADLLSYTGEYQSLMDIVRKSFVSPAFDQLFTRLQEDSLLKEVRMLLGGPIGDRLRRDNLWPLRFMTLDRASITPQGDGKVEAAFELSVYSRK